MKTAQKHSTSSKDTPSKTYLDFQAEQSDEWSCKTEVTSTGRIDTQTNAIRLMSAKEAGQILGINPNVVYALWRKKLLDYWNIHGTKKTNLNAIMTFLEDTRNQELMLDDGKENH